MKIRNRNVLVSCAAALALLFAPAGGYAQQGASVLHRVAGIYVASAYSNWSDVVTGGPYAPGTTSITVASPVVTLADGYQFSPFAVGNSIAVGAGSNDGEVVTITGVSGCSQGSSVSPSSCTITATFANSHGSGDLVMSSSGGVNEALFDAGSHGGGKVQWEADSGDVTLSTPSATTTLCSNCIPANAVIEGVVARVGTTITGCSGGWELGDGTTAARFAAANTTLTAGTVSAADVQNTSGIASASTGIMNQSASPKSIVNTCVTSNASAGAIHVHAFGFVLATPNN
jgi:hypothetical protein